MTRILPILFAVGCAAQTPTSTSPPDGSTTTGGPFAHDTYYTGIVPPYATPEACRAANTSSIMCNLELGFCASGKASAHNFDLYQDGVYHLEGPLIVATLDGGEVTLDTRTGQVLIPS